MSVSSSSQMEGDKEAMAQNAPQFVRTVLTLGGGIALNPGNISSFTEQIACLKKEIQGKSEAISRVNEDVKELREQNDDLKITVESKNREIKSLRDKIDKLETEKKALETKLRTVEVELDAVRKEVDELKKANKIHEEKNETMEVNVEKLSRKMDGVKSENTSLKKELNDLREEVQRKTPLGVSERMALPYLSDPAVDGASVVLDELCRQIQIMMYKKVLPNSYEDRKSYKVKHIEEDIKGLEDKQQQDHAQQTWDELKTTLKWKERMHKRAMKSIQDNRNMAAHPEINEGLIRTSADLMEEAGKLTDWLNLACVQELIEMWKQLKQQQ